MSDELCTECTDYDWDDERYGVGGDLKTAIHRMIYEDRCPHLIQAVLDYRLGNILTQLGNHLASASMNILRIDLRKALLREAGIEALNDYFAAAECSEQRFKLVSTVPLIDQVMVAARETDAGTRGLIAGGIYADLTTALIPFFMVATGEPSHEFAVACAKNLAQSIYLLACQRLNSK